LLLKYKIKTDVAVKTGQMATQIPILQHNSCFRNTVSCVIQSYNTNNSYLFNMFKLYSFIYVPFVDKYLKLIKFCRLYQSKRHEFVLYECIELCGWHWNLFYYHTILLIYYYSTIHNEYKFLNHFLFLSRI